jgi:superfamily II DNA or RNA helicase
MVDEAHRNTLGAQSASVLGHFSGAQVIGLTATPYRADRKELGSFYQHISCEIGLVRLIREGWLAPIKIRCVPCNVSLSGVRTSAGDYRDTDLAERLDPHVLEFARILKENAPGRRTVVFTPLIQTAERFAEACRSLGMKAIHASGKDREGVDAFARREVDIIANSALLTTGWDQPDVDCVYVLRPTKSHALYSQMIGRGTRLHPGKDHLLVLDPLFLSEDMSLIRPSRLIAATSEEAESVEKVLESGGDVDLLEAKAKADVDREKSMRKRAEEMAKRKRKEFDAVEFSLAIANDELAGYVPQTEWEQAAPTEGQMDALVNMGFAKDTITCRGFAHRLLEILLRRREDRMATPKQLRWLLRYHYPNARRATFAEASAFLDRKWSGSKADKRKPSATKTAVSLFSEVTNVS